MPHILNTKTLYTINENGEKIPVETFAASAPIDKTLSKEYYAADAKVTGFKINNLTRDIGNRADLITDDNSSLVAAINEVLQKTNVAQHIEFLTKAEYMQLQKSANVIYFILEA